MRLRTRPGRARDASVSSGSIVWDASGTCPLLFLPTELDGLVFPTELDGLVSSNRTGWPCFSQQNWMVLFLPTELDGLGDAVNSCFESERSATHQAPPPPLLLHAGDGSVDGKMGDVPLSPLSGARCAGGGCRGFRDSPGRIPARKSAPRAARPPPCGARCGRAEGADGSGGWLAFQRLFRDTPVLQPWRPVWRKRCHGSSVQRESANPVFWAVCQFRILSLVGAKDLGNPAFAPRFGFHAARTLGTQAIRMVPGSRLAFQRVSGTP
eukprot:gene10160-biopygen22787